MTDRHGARSCSSNRQRAKWENTHLLPWGFVLLCWADNRRRSAAGETTKRIKFMRGLAEATGFQPGTFDMVVFSFIAHECPQQALKDFVAEAHRILKPGGVVCFVDNNPR